MFEKAIDAFNSGDMKSALSQMSKIEVRETDMNKVNFLYANIYFKMDEYGKSLKYLQDCINGCLLNDEVFRLAEIAQRKSKIPLNIKVYKQTLNFLIKSENSLNLFIQTLRNADQASVALTILNKMLESNPNHLHLLKLKATILGRLEPSWEGAYTLRKIVELEPSAEAYSNLGSVLFRLSETRQALSNYVKSIRLKPDYEVVYYNLGNLFKDQLKYSWAIKCYEKSISYGRDKISVFNNLANTLIEKGEFNKAEEFLEAVLIERPDVIEIKYNLGLLKVKKGETNEGWQLFKHRWDVGGDKLARAKREYTKPMWQGDIKSSGKLLIWREQGVGDEIQLTGMIQAIKHNFSEIRVEFDPRLVPLMKRSLPQLNVQPDRMTGSEDYFDYHLPIGELPVILNVTKDWQVPQPFLKPDPIVVNEIRNALLSKAEGRKIVGLSWRSGMRSKSRDLNYTQLKYWEDLITDKRVFVVCLQYSDILEDIEELSIDAQSRLFRPAVDLKDDFDNVAALISACDMYVGPFTATTGLVGGLGVKSYTYTDSFNVYTFGRGRPGLVASHPLLYNNETYFYDYTNKSHMLTKLKQQVFADLNAHNVN